jgi:hypothetical protein
MQARSIMFAPKKNMGVIGMYSFNPSQANQMNAASSQFVQIGICKQLGKYTIPELGLAIKGPEAYGLNPTMTGVFSNIHFRKNLFVINQRKHGAKCKAEVLECFVTPEYRYSFENKRTETQNQFSVRYGLSLYHVESGGSKRSRAWVTKFEVYHRNYVGNYSPAGNEFGVGLRIQHFKTYDFLK